MLTKLRAATLVTVAAMGLLIGACGADNPLNNAANAGQKQAKPPATAAPELTSALGTNSNDQLGEIVVDGEGRTLYRFEQDTTNPPVSNCVDACADKWPPVLAGEKVSVDGIDASLVGTVDRPDGTRQVTLNGRALYRFADDKTAGDAKGQGVNGSWFASTPTGDKAPAADQPKKQDNQDDQADEKDKADQKDNQDDSSDNDQDDDSGYGY